MYSVDGLVLSTGLAPFVGVKHFRFEAVAAVGTSEPNTLSHR
jgi:hypothetical protein